MVRSTSWQDLFHSPSGLQPMQHLPPNSCQQHHEVPWLTLLQIPRPEASAADWAASSSA